MSRTRRSAARRPSSPRALFFLGLAAFALSLAASGGARAQRWERPPPDDDHRGVYFAAGLGGGLQLVNLDDGTVGGQVDLRFGYSFNRLFQIYLEGDFSASSHLAFDGSSTAITADDFMVGLRYFFYADRFTGVYARVGLGLGVVSGLANYYQDGGADTVYGIAESYALGMEFRLDKKWSLSPELFYRRTNETDDGSRVDTLGLGLLINFN